MILSRLVFLCFMGRFSAPTNGAIFAEATNQDHVVYYLAANSSATCDALGLVSSTSTCRDAAAALGFIFMGATSLAEVVFGCCSLSVGGLDAKVFFNSNNASSASSTATATATRVICKYVATEPSIKHAKDPHYVRLSGAQRCHDNAHVTSAAQCEEAAQSLHLADVTAKVEEDQGNHPIGCYFLNNQLVFNTRMISEKYSCLFCKNDEYNSICTLPYLHPSGLSSQKHANELMRGRSIESFNLPPPFSPSSSGSSSIILSSTLASLPSERATPVYSATSASAGACTWEANLTGVLLGSSSHSVVMHVEWGAPPASPQWLLHLGQDGADSHYWIYNSPTSFGFGAWGGDLDFTSLDATLGDCAIIATTYEASSHSYSLYCDGELVHLQVNHNFNISSTRIRFGVGAGNMMKNERGSDFQGCIKEVAMYDTWLSPADVSGVSTGMMAVVSRRAQAVFKPTSKSALQAAVNAWIGGDTTTYGDNINAWDVSLITDMSDLFLSKSTFNSDISSWDVSSVTTMSQMFKAAALFNQNIGSWDVSRVRNMYFLFNGASKFNQPIGGWVVSSVTTMTQMFKSAVVFNQNIGSWDVSQVRAMDGMFNSASAFNQPIGSWNMSKVTSSVMSMFQSALVFDQDIGSWDVSKITSMAAMFYSARAFNKDIGAWDVSSVTTMSSMFGSALLFNQDLGSWDVSSVTNINGMFNGARVFNQAIGSWNVSKVTALSSLFTGAIAFNQNIGSWDTSKVRSIYSIFSGATAFNQDIGSWDVSSVTDMGSAFSSASAFNQDIGRWDVSKTLNMFQMFRSTIFNQDIGPWDVSHVTSMENMFYLAAFNTVVCWDMAIANPYPTLIKLGPRHSVDTAGTCVCPADTVLNTLTGIRGVCQRTPTAKPTGQPSSHPTSVPSGQPSCQPISPSRLPSKQPSAQPSGQPSALPTSPSLPPTILPLAQPSGKPSCQPSMQPTVQPSGQPSNQPSGQPTKQPSAQPSEQSSGQPTGQPTTQPLGEPSCPPSAQPTLQPSLQPSGQPSSQPSVVPSSEPSTMPSSEPIEAPVTSAPTVPGVTNKPTTRPTLAPTHSPSFSLVNPPQVHSCRFANDGSYFVLKFDILSDRGKFGRSHPCSKIFEFYGDTTALCVWQNDQSVKVFPSGPLLIAVGGLVVVKEKVVRAQCPALASAEECSHWQTSQDAKCTVAAPLAPVSPVVSISAPSVLSQCKSYTLDLTASSGAGGRPWSRQVVNVSSVSQSSSSLFHQHEIEDFFRNHYSLSPPSALQSGYLMGNETYIFEVTLCNFLLQCRTSSTTVQIKTLKALPVVTIAGSSSRHVKRSDSVSLQSSAFIGTCDSTNRYSGMIFRWTVSVGGVMNSQLSSTSNSPFAFTLPAGKLTVGSTYVITVTVTDSVSGGKSHSSVTVTVISSAVVAVITGGAVQSWRVGESAFIVDGSSSYDLDIGHGMANQNLNYLWSCDKSSSKIVLDASFCSQLLPATLQQSSKVTLNMAFMDFSAIVGATFVLKLDISGSGGRTASAVVTVAVAESRSPKITLLSSPGKINAMQPIQILASVQVASAATGVWTLNDKNINLAAIVSIPSLWVKFPKQGRYVFNLAIKGSSLVAGSSYDFVMSVSGEGGLATSTVTVIVVEPPRLGQLLVNPSTGSEFVDLFQFTTSRWTDDELPLTYSFGYFSFKSAAMVELQGRGESAFVGDKYLPQGPASRQFNLTCGVYAFNALNARSARTQAVKVLAQSVSAQKFQAAVTIRLNEVSGHQDINAVKSIVSVGVSILNVANCSLAPENCSDIGREACSATPHTCGPCLVGKIGESTGDGNSPCFSVSSASLGVEVALNGTCLIMADCLTMQSCVKGKCTYPAKTCPADCSGRGKCRRERKTSGLAVSECLVNDFTCQARCVCDEGYLGIGCSESQSAMEAKRQTRLQFISHINSTVQYEDATIDALTARVVMLVDLGSNPSELTTASCLLLQQILGNILGRAADDVEFSMSTLTGLRGVLDNCDVVFVEAAVGGDGSGGASYALVESRKTLRSRVNGLVYKSMVEGESVREFVDSLSRSSVSTNAATDSGEQLVPQTTLEEFFVEEKSYVMVDGLSSSDAADLTRSIVLEENEVSLYLNASDFVANPLKVWLVLSSTSDEDTPSVEGVSTSVLVVIRNSAEAQYITNTSHSDSDNSSSPTVTRFVTDCTAKNDTARAAAGYASGVFNYTCPGGDVVTHHCTGAIQVITSVCPALRFMPSCRLLSSNSWSGAVAETPQCSLISFTPWNVTCNCTLVLQPSSSSSGGRRLVMSSSAEESSGYIEIAAMAEYSFEGFVSTNNEVTKMSVDDLKSGMIVLIMFACLWGLGLLSLYELVKVHWCCTTTPEQPVTLRRRQASTANRAMTLRAKKDYLLNHIDAILPMIFRTTVHYETTLEAMWATIKAYHAYTALFALKGQGATSSRCIKMTYLLTIHAMLMFIMALLYELQMPGDDGYCRTQTSEAACMSRRSMFDHTETTCAWVEGEATCVFRQVEISMQSIVLISILISIATAPINIIVDSLFQDFILAPTADENKMNQVGRGFLGHSSVNAAGATGTGTGTGTGIGGAIRASFDPVTPSSNDVPVAAQPASSSVLVRIMTFFQEHFRVEDTNTRILPPDVVMSRASTFMILKDDFDEGKVDENDSRRRSTRLSRQSTIKRLYRHPEPAHAPLDLAERGEGGSAESSFEGLCAGLQEHSRVLSGVAKSEFEASWGLRDGYDVASQMDGYPGMFVDDELGVKAGVSAKIRGGGAKCWRGGESTRREVLSLAIDHTAKEANEKIQKLSLASDAHVGLEIMHLFIIDLLGKDTAAAKIFNSMSSEDFSHTHVVTKTAKRFAWVAVIFINVYFVYYSVLKGISMSVEWQWNFVVACVLQIIVEIFVYETCECLWIHYVIPKLVADEVATSMKTVKASISAAFKKNQQVRSDFDSPEFFFVARQLADHFSNLFESSIVLSFHSYFPPSELDCVVASHQQSQDQEHGHEEQQKLLSQKVQSPDDHYEDNDYDDDNDDAWVGHVGGNVVVGRKKKRPLATFMRRFNIRILVLSLLLYIGTFPMRLQQVAIHTLQPILFSFIIIFYFFLVAHPLASIGIMAFVLYETIVYSNNRDRRRVVPAINDAKKNTISMVAVVTEEITDREGESGNSKIDDGIVDTLKEEGRPHAGEVVDQTNMKVNHRQIMDEVVYSEQKDWNYTENDAAPSITEKLIAEVSRCVFVDSIASTSNASGTNNAYDDDYDSDSEDDDDVFDSNRGSDSHRKHVLQKIKKLLEQRGWAERAVEIFCAKLAGGEWLCDAVVARPFDPVWKDLAEAYQTLNKMCGSKSENTERRMDEQRKQADRIAQCMHKLLPTLATMEGTGGDASGRVDPAQVLMLLERERRRTAFVAAGKKGRDGVGTAVRKELSYLEKKRRLIEHSLLLRFNELFSTH